MFLIRAAFWLTLVILLLPAGGPERQDIGAIGQEVSPAEAITAARDTVSDLAGFCERNPDTCRTGSAALRLFAEKAQYGAMKLYEYIAAMNGETGAPTRAAASGGDTLSPEDRALPWHGPDAQS